jgi:CO dehydrogenase/acetyl-CoA synthase delta subunit
LSVEGDHARLIWELVAAVALRVAGVEGGTMSMTPVVVAVAAFETTETLPAASSARTV